MIMIWQGAAIGVIMEMQLAVITPHHGSTRVKPHLKTGRCDERNKNRQRGKVRHNLRQHERHKGRIQP